MSPPWSSSLVGKNKPGPLVGGSVSAASKKEGHERRQTYDRALDATVRAASHAGIMLLSTSDVTRSDCVTEHSRLAAVGIAA
jgi:hypothetical protein